jgi:hypothetical protein
LSCLGLLFDAERNVERSRGGVQPRCSAESSILLLLYIIIKYIIIIPLTALTVKRVVFRIFFLVTLSSNTHATSRFSPQESFEAWANLGGVHMRMRQWPQAFCALDEAIKLSRSNWKLWQNYLYTALSSDHVTAAIDAAENLLELQVWRHIIHTPFLFC